MYDYNQGDTTYDYRGAIPREYHINRMQVKWGIFYGGADKLPDYEWLLEQQVSSYFVFSYYTIN